MLGYIKEVAKEDNLKPDISAVLPKIAMCESSDKPNAIHYNFNGTVDRSIFQINSVHRIEALAMGLNIAKWQDNIKYAVYLASTSGLKPWQDSAHCWH